MSKLVFATITTAVVGFGLVATPVSATNVSGNRGSNVKVSSCSDLGTAVTGNRGSNIHIDGKGCDIAEVVKSGVVDNNRGSNIKITNVCGDANHVKATNNRGSNVKITTTGSCKTEKSSAKPAPKPAPVVKVEKPKASAAPVVKTETPEKPAEKAAEVTALPETGVATSGAVVAALGGATYAVSRLFARR